MYKLALSVNGTLINEAIFRACRDAGIQAMEVSCALDHLDWEELRSWSDAYGVELWTVHLPFGPVDISNPAIAAESVEQQKGYIAKAAAIGVKNFVIHPSGEPIEEADRPGRMACAKESLRQLAAFAAALGCTIAVEDLPRTCLGNCSADILELLSAHEALCVCYDTNHLLEEDNLAFIRAVGEKIITLHVSDYDFIDERHWLPGEGKNDWPAILKTLQEVGYDGPWLYEIGFEAPWHVERPRDLTCADFAENHRQLMAGEKLTPIGVAKENLDGFMARKNTEGTTMKWIQDELTRRKLPDLLNGASTPEEFAARREEIKALLIDQCYGEFPPAPEKVDFEIVKDDPFCAGHATLQEILAHCTLPGGKVFSFKFFAVIPTRGDNFPAFVHINFRPDVPDRYMPSEELCDNGFAVFSFWCNELNTDDHAGDFSNGIASLLFPDGKRGDTGASKLTMWAWGAMRVMDYIQTLDCIDKKNIAVVGHSRMGKTAMIAGGFDERFAFVISNDSGCGGAALHRGKNGETIAFMSQVLWFWHCENYLKYNGDASALPFDQHFLAALTCPRKLYIASGSMDDWADPTSEYLCGFAASPAWALFGEKGLVGEDRPPVAEDVYHEGSIGYHCRHGRHYLSRWDWLRFMEYIRKHYNT